jgi:hypothetical protein
VHVTRGQTELPGDENARGPGRGLARVSQDPHALVVATLVLALCLASLVHLLNRERQSPPWEPTALAFFCDPSTPMAMAGSFGYRMRLVVMVVATTVSGLESSPLAIWNLALEPSGPLLAAAGCSTIRHLPKDRSRSRSPSDRAEHVIRRCEFRKFCPLPFRKFWPVPG